MKNVLLVGDSIRAGYDQYVKESFEGQANVYFIGENGRFAQYVLRNLHEWVENTGEERIDVIHWNAGLWDTLRVYEDDCLTPIDTYVDFLLRIQSRIEKICPEAISIFATSTPVIEDGFIPDYSIRYNVDIERYNRAAVETLTKRGVIINDLYALLKDAPVARGGSRGVARYVQGFVMLPRFRAASKKYWMYSVAPAAKQSKAETGCCKSKTAK